MGQLLSKQHLIYLLHMHLIKANGSNRKSNADLEQYVSQLKKVMQLKKAVQLSLKETSFPKPVGIGRLLMYEIIDSQGFEDFVLESDLAETNKFGEVGLFQAVPRGLFQR